MNHESRIEDTEQNLWILGKRGYLAQIRVAEVDASHSAALRRVIVGRMWEALS